MNKRTLFLLLFLVFIFTGGDSAFAAINGQCGSANSGYFTSFPSSGLCSQGTFSASEASTFEDYRWNCLGIDGGTNASCRAYLNSVTYPVCASFSNNQTSSAPGPNERCKVGKSSWLKTNYTGSVVSSWSWDCQGTGTTTSPVITCSVKYSGSTSIPAPVNGSCGASNKGTFSSAPTGNLCSAGTLTSFSGNGPWYWTCLGQDGGSNASCYANKTQQYHYNSNPTVNAGPDKQINAGQSMYLYATAFDPDGDYLTYQWSCTGGSLSSYNSLNPIFYAPSSSYNYNYTCTLTVNDGRGGSASDSVNISTGTAYYGNLSVSTNMVSNVTNVSAKLNGYLSEDGGENTSVRFVWGRSNYLNNYTSWIDYKRSGSYFYADIYNLERGKVYQFRAEARNGRNNVYGSTLRFITKPDDPYNFDARLLGNYQVQLSWNTGQGACNTAITRRTSGYPISVSDGILVYYGNDTSFVDNSVFSGNTYYYRAWSIACDEGMYAVSDSLSAKDYAVISQPITYTPTVVQKVIVEKAADLAVDVVARNLTQDKTSCPTGVSWRDSITAEPGDEIEMMITISASNGNAENVILTNALPVKIDEVYDLKIEEQTVYGDANGSFILGTILQGKSKTVIFKVRLNKEDSFAYGATDLMNTAEANAKNVETARDTLNIRVSKGIGGEAMGGLSGFISRNWKIFYLFLGILLGLIFFLFAYFFFQEQERKRRARKEDIVLEKSKYFHVQ